MTRSRRWFTQTLLLTTSGMTLALFSRQQVHAQEAIQVTTSEAFVQAIGPNRTIELASGSFTLSDIDPGLQTPYVRFESVFDGYELVISDVENLTIVGTDNTLSRLLTQPRYADVLKFINCQNLSLQNLELAHTKDAGFCRGSVLSFGNCQTVQIDQCVLIGSGTHGIEAQVLSNLTCRASVIKECTYGILCLNSATAVRFENCQFYENTGFSMVNLSDCQQVSFVDCLMYDNASESRFVGNDFMFFNVEQSQSIEVIGSQLYNNAVAYLAPSTAALTLTNVALEGNTFAPSTLYPEDPTIQSSPFCPL